MKLLVKTVFDGSNFCGFQAQPGRRSVQGELTERFGELFGFPVTVTGCSRTDSGVHALGYCLAIAPTAPCDGSWCAIPTSKFCAAANTALPSDIAAVAAAEMPDEFHPRYSAVKKEYIYKICDSPVLSPFVRGRAMHFKRRISDSALLNMKKAAALFEGTHDFTSFMAKGSKITDPVRTVYSTDVKRDSDGLVCFTVSADGFLYNMVRIMAGTLLRVASGKVDCGEITEIINSRRRESAGETAAPYGLYLNEVTYPFDIRWNVDG